MDYPNRRTFTIRKTEEIKAIEEDSSGEEAEINKTTLSILDVGDPLIVRRALHFIKATHLPSQHEQIFHARCINRSKVCELIIDGGICI